MHYRSWVPRSCDRQGGSQSLLLPGVLACAMLGVGLAAGVLLAPRFLAAPIAQQQEPTDTDEPATVELAEVADAAQPADQPAPATVGFQMGSPPMDELINSIRVTLHVGAEGEDLQEPVDLHLGVGFPLRLYPLGTEERTPAFAAFPQQSSLQRGSTKIRAGESGTFEFSAAASPSDAGQDELLTTPQLLADLKVGDLQRVSFASQGRTDWVLDGYTIEVNGQLFAAHDSVDVHPQHAQLELRGQLAELLPAHEVLAREVADLEAYLSTGLAGDEDKASLETKRAALAESADEINDLGAQIAGASPWYVESDPNFQPQRLAGKPVENLAVTLITGGGERPGSRNPVYLWSGGRKLLLSSEVDPLSDEPVEQRFEFTNADLKTTPLSDALLRQPGLGMVGNHQRFGRVPDRARPQRVVVEVDGRVLYDSEQQSGDRRVLESVWLIPPAHRDESGHVVQNEASDRELYLWRAGRRDAAEALALVDSADTRDQAVLPDEPPPIEPLDSPLTGLAPGTTPLAEIDPGAGVATPTTGGLAAAGGLPFGVSSGFPGGSGGGLPALVIVPASVGNVARLLGPSGLPPAPIQPLIPPIRRAIGQPNALTQLAAALANALSGTPLNPAQALAPAPAPAVPTIAAVQIDPGTPIVRVGDQVRVNWQVLGNASQVSSYRVDLFGVLPDRNPPLLNAPIATQFGIAAPRVAAAGGAQSMSGQTPAINLASIQGQLTGAQSTYLYVRPRVTALDANGNAITTAWGSLLPLFPAGTSSDFSGRTPRELLLLGPSPILVPNTTPPSYLTRAASAGQPNPWIPFASTDPQTASSAWRLVSEQDSHFALRFASYQPAPSTVFNIIPAHNAAVRPANNGETVTIDLIGLIPISANVNGYRLIAHLGFIGGTTTASTAQVLSRVTVFDRSTPPNTAFLLQTPQPMTLNKFAAGQSPGPLLLIDMPVRFATLNAGNLANYPADTSRYQVTTFNPGLWATVSGQGVGFVNVQLMLQLQSGNSQDAIGVFGVRLVADTTP